VADHGVQQIAEGLFGPREHHGIEANNPVVSQIALMLFLKLTNSDQC